MEFQKWEYKRFISDWSDKEFTILQELNSLGDEGWELVTVVPESKLQKQTFYFKRPAQVPADIAFTSEPIGLQPRRY